MFTAEIVTLYLMAQQISRRGFVKASLIASAAVPLGLSDPTHSSAQSPAAPAVSTATPPQETMPKGKMGGQEFGRLIMGGNLRRLVPLARPRLCLHPHAPLQHRRQDTGDARIGRGPRRYRHQHLCHAGELASLRPLEVRRQDEVVCPGPP